MQWSCGVCQLSQSRPSSLTQQWSMFLSYRNNSLSFPKNQFTDFPTNIYLLKVNYRNTRKRCELCSELIIKTSEWHQCSCSVFWCFYCWLGTYVKPFSNVSNVDFEQVYGSWVKCDGSNCLKWGKLDLQPFQIQFPQTSFKNNSNFIVSFFVPKVWKILCWCWISEVSLTWLDLTVTYKN